MQLPASLALMAGLFTVLVPSQPPATPMLSRPVSATTTAVTPSQQAADYGLFLSEAASPASRFPGTRTFRERSKPSSEEAQLNSTIRQAMQNLKSPESSKEAAAVETLRQSLKELFDIRSGARAKQIADLESRLQKLREQLNERNTRKAEIVDLRVQTIVNEANGMTF